MYDWFDNGTLHGRISKLALWMGAVSGLSQINFGVRQLLAMDPDAPLGIPKGIVISERLGKYLTGDAYRKTSPIPPRSGEFPFANNARVLFGVFVRPIEVV